MAVVRELLTTLGFQIKDQDKVKHYEDSFKKLKESAIHFVEIVGAIEIGKKMLEIAADTQKNTIALEAFTGSAKQAGEIMQHISKYSMKTGIPSDAFEKAATTMTSMGVSSEQTMKNLDVIGDIAAGLGTDKIPVLAQAFAKMNQKGFADGRALQQMMISGVPIFEELRKQTGMNTKQLMEMANVGMLKMTDVNKALTSLTTGSGKFANLASKQANTLFGVWGRGKETFKAFSEELTEKLTPSLVSAGNEILNAFQGNMGNIAEKIKQGMRVALYWLGYFFETLRRSALPKEFGKLIEDLLKFFSNLTEGISKMFGGASILKGVIDDLALLTQTLDLLLNTLNGDWVSAWANISDNPITSNINAGFEQNLVERVNADPKNQRRWQALIDFERKNKSPLLGQNIEAARKNGINVQDAIITKTGQVINTSPDDNIIATKMNPLSKQGGGSVVYNINTNVALGVPAGTPAVQQQALTDIVRKITRQQWQENLREIATNTPRTDWAGAAS